MAAAKTAIKKGQEGQKFRYFNGVQVTPTLYNGRAVGEGKFLSGAVRGELILDDNGVPMKWRDIGVLATSAPTQE